MARERPTASDVKAPTLALLDGGKPNSYPQLTRAEAHALRRSAPLTHMRLAEHLRGVPQAPRPGA